jgi:proteasome lid subunit RPN8/RPN11
MAEAVYPYEGCGILVGQPGEVAEVTEVRQAQNLRGPEDRARDRYLMDPAAIMTAQREADDIGLDIVGFWHSHPDHPSRPSQYDIDHAGRWPGYVFVIVSVQQGHAEEDQGWVRSSEAEPGMREELLEG